MSHEQKNELIVELTLQNRRYEQALRRIEKWFGEFPEVPNEDGRAVGYEGHYGSNGARDYMRGVAREALSNQ